MSRADHLWMQASIGDPDQSGGRGQVHSDTSRRGRPESFGDRRRAKGPAKLPVPLTPCGSPKRRRPSSWFDRSHQASSTRPSWSPGTSTMRQKLVLPVRTAVAVPPAVGAGHPQAGCPVGAAVSRPSTAVHYRVGQHDAAVPRTAAPRRPRSARCVDPSIIEGLPQATVPRASTSASRLGNPAKRVSSTDGRWSRRSTPLPARAALSGDAAHGPVSAVGSCGTGPRRTGSRRAHPGRRGRRRLG